MKPLQLMHFVAMEYRKYFPYS